MSAPDSTAFRKRFRAGIRRRNRREGASCVLVAVIGAGGWLSAPASQLGLGFGLLWWGATHHTAGITPMTWLILGYLLHTTGELCLSPVGLSMVTSHDRVPAFSAAPCVMKR